MRKKPYYHITSPENVESILNNGLKANKRGEIFLFDESLVEHNQFVFKDGELVDVRNRISPTSDVIAFNQLGIRKYATFKVKVSGISGEISNDNVAEYSAQYQYIVHQDTIHPKYLELVCEKEVNPNMFQINE